MSVDKYKKLGITVGFITFLWGSLLTEEEVEDYNYVGLRLLKKNMRGI